MVQLPYDLKYLIVTQLASESNFDIFKALRSLQLTDKTFRHIVRSNPSTLAQYRDFAKQKFEYPYAFQLLDMWRPHGMNDFARRQLKRYTRFGPIPLWIGDVDKTLDVNPDYIGPAEVRRLVVDCRKLEGCVDHAAQKFAYGNNERLSRLDLLRGYYIAVSLARHFVPLPMDFRHTELKPKGWRSLVGREHCSNQGVFNHLAYLRLPGFDFKLLCATYRDVSARDAFKMHQCPLDINTWRMDFGPIESVYPLRRKSSLHVQVPDQLHVQQLPEPHNAFYWVQPFKTSALSGEYKSGFPDESRILLPQKIVACLEKAVGTNYGLLWEPRDDGNYIELMKEGNKGGS